MSFTVFHTQMSRPHQLRGFPFSYGITLGDASAGAVEIAIADLRAGRRVMVDNGAFGAWRRGEPLGFDEFDTVLARYEDFIGLKGTPLLVAPDVMLDPVATRDLRKRFLERIGYLMSEGAEVMLPLQGPGSRHRLEQAVELVAPIVRGLRLSGSGNAFVLGIPCVGDSAVPDFQVEWLIERTGMTRWHFLGGVTRANVARCARYGLTGSADSGQAAITARNLARSTAEKQDLQRYYAGKIEADL